MLARPPRFEKVVLSLGTVTPEELRAAQVFTFGTLALWLLLGFVPPLRRYARSAQACLLIVFLAGCAAFLAYVFFR